MNNNLLSLVVVHILVVRLGLGKKVNNNMMSLVCMAKVSEECEQQPVVSGLYGYG